MKALKVPKKNAQDTKKKYLNKIDFSKEVQKDDGYLYFPLKEIVEGEIVKGEIVEIEAKDVEKNDFRDEIKKLLTKKELEFLKLSFDVIGSIAILEIDDELKAKENKIAEVILSHHKNIQGVFKKAGAHGGTFRTQKLEWLAGEKTKETIHHENGIRLKLDVEDVYFSPRLSTERQRILNLVEDGEKILVMFSGCGPYSVLLSKKRKVDLVSVEINPVGVSYQVENLKLNNVNFAVLEGDVRDIVPKLLNKKIGLKSHWSKEQLDTKLKCNPKIMEIHLNPEDLDKHYSEIEDAIKELLGKNIEVVLHAPMEYHGTEQNLAAEDETVLKNSIEACDKVTALVRKYKLKGFVGHAVTENPEKQNYSSSYEVLNENLKRYPEMFIENSPHKFFSNNKIDGKFCLDCAHLFISHPKTFYKDFRRLSEGAYVHIADALYHYDKVEDHAIRVGDGKIDFTKILPYIEEGVVEPYVADQLSPVEMFDSLDRLKEMLKPFDRILMPLPMNAGEFLDVALKVSKKGTVIHLYDFLHEDEIEHKRKELEKVGKIIGFTKCGQFSPKKYRVCFDIENESNNI